MIKYKHFILGFFVFIIFFIAHGVSADVNIGVASITVSVSKPAENVDCTVTVRVKNEGDEDITSMIGLNDYNFGSNYFRVKNTVEPSVSSSNVWLVGEEIEYEFTGYFIQKGFSSFSFDVNGNRELLEKAYSDNDLRSSVEVIEAYDIYIPSVETMPATPAMGQNTVLKVKVKNNGQRDIINRYGLDTIDIETDDFEVIKIDIPEISYDEPFEIGKDIEYSVHGRFLGTGDQIIRFYIDKDNDLDESNEDNNSKEQIFNVVESKNLDIAVDSITFDLKEATDIIINKPIAIKVGVKNIGDVAVESGAGLNFVDIDKIFTDFNSQSLILPEMPSAVDYFESGETLEYVYEGFFDKRGDKILSFNIDRKGVLDELNKKNNTMDKTIRVYPDEKEANTVTFSNIRIMPISSSSVVYRWNTNRKSTGLVKYGESNYYDYIRYAEKIHLRKWPEDIIIGEEHEVVINNLFPGREYRSVIEANRNDLLTKSESIQFTMPVSDELIIKKDLTYEKRESGVSISWETNLLTNSCIMFGKKGGIFEKKDLDDSVLEHKLLLTSLEDGDYEAYLCDNNDQRVFFYVVSITDIEEVDTNKDKSEIEVTKDTIENNTEGDSEIINKQKTNFEIKNKKMHSSLKGKIMLKVESNGEAYYISPDKEEMYYLGRPKDAFSVMREQGIGITNKDLYKIPVGILQGGLDTDGDGLADNLEDALGLDSSRTDTDGDGFSDKSELENGYSPWGRGNQVLDNTFSSRQSGKILLQVEENGEAWYVNPADEKRYFLGRPADAFAVMRSLGLGISNSNFDSL